MKVASNFAAALARAARSSSDGLSTISTLLRISSFRLADFSELFEHRHVAVGDAALGVEQHRHDVGVVRAAPCGRHHGAVEPAAGRENSRRIDQHDLRLPHHGDAAHQRARRLHLGRDDRHFRSDQRVDQCRLAGVGRADQRDKAAAGLAGSSMGRSGVNALARQHGGGGSLFGGAFRSSGSFGRVRGPAIQP